MNNDNERFKLNRCRYYERDWISITTKREVATKTDGKCAICGKKIKPGTKEFTIDHFIPLNKGGSNNTINLIPLCEDCNIDKGDDVTTIDKKYPFLKNKHKNELKELTNRYLKEYNWIQSNNFLTYDDQVVDLPVLGYRKKIRGKERTFSITSSFRIRKVHELTDDILNFVINYNAYFGYETDFIEGNLIDYINDGRLYVVTKDKEDDIKYILYFKLVKASHTMCDGSLSDNYDVIQIGNIIGKPKQSHETNWAKAAFIDIIMLDIIESARALGLKTISLAIETDIVNMDLYEDFKYQMYEQFGYYPSYMIGDEKPGEFVGFMYNFNICKDKDELDRLTDEEFDALILEDSKKWSEQLAIGRRQDEED